MHYKNGREAHVGDPVVGTTYNLGGRVIAGTLIALTPGEDACSVEVGYLETTPVAAEQLSSYGPPVVALHGDANHGNSGQVMVTRYKTDAGECKLLLHAEDAWVATEK